jgi:hypothetical protein
VQRNVLHGGLDDGDRVLGPDALGRGAQDQRLAGHAALGERLQQRGDAGRLPVGLAQEAR